MHVYNYIYVASYTSFRLPRLCRF